MDEASLFNAARQIPEAEVRRAYLDRACGEDKRLRTRLEALLRVHEQDRSFLEAPAVPTPAARLRPAGEEPGSQIGPYQLVEQIGEGGFGVVFRAEQQQPLRSAAARSKT
jgi:hypothetical protein